MEGWAREAGLQLIDLSGMSYNPLTREYSLGKDVSVNYLACFQKA
jgi:2-polyprenyl-6-hydroxyphenyl methylase/3-demethylubiquinone-9 3-methyltransferase